LSKKTTLVLWLEYLGNGKLFLDLTYQKIYLIGASGRQTHSIVSIRIRKMVGLNSKPVEYGGCGPFIGRQDNAQQIYVYPQQWFWFSGKY